MQPVALAPVRERRRRRSSAYNAPSRPASRAHSPARRRRRNRRAVRLFRRILMGTLVLALLVVCAVCSANFLLFQKPEIQKTAPAAVYLPPLVFPPEEDEEESPPVIAEDTAVPSDETHTIRKDNFYTILLAGADKGYGGSDTIILLSIDAENNRLYGVSIPRDTKAIIGGKSQKINAAYQLGRMPLLSSTISDQLGIPIDFTMEVQLDGFSRLVDAIGGVEFDVPLDMNYDDEAQDLYIHVSKGLQLLDGETALQVVRFRHNNDGTGYGSEDLGRIATQQNFLKAVARKLLTLRGLLQLKELAKVFEECVNTELTVRNLLWLGQEVLSIGMEGIEFSTMPGSWKYPYIYTDKAAALELINAHLNPYQEDRLPEDLHIPD